SRRDGRRERGFSPLQPLEQKSLAGAVVVVGVLPGDHLAGIEQPLRVGLALEGKLYLVGLLHAALLQRVAVRVEDRAAILLEGADDLVQPLFSGEAHKVEAETGDVAVEADEF